MVNTLGFKSYDYEKLNTLTKYPSILTYHDLGTRGGLKESLVNNESFAGKEVMLTEKVDGTNARLIFVTDEAGVPIDYILGSRENLLYAHGDRVINPALHIVESMSFYANWLLHVPGIALKPDHIYVLYGELYGGNLNAYKNYTTYNEYGVRFFDAWAMPLEDIDYYLTLDIAKISSWREHGGQPYMTVKDLGKFLLHLSAEDENKPADFSNIIFKRVPYLEVIDGAEIPTDLKGVYNFLKEFEKSLVILDDGANAKSEGIVVRTSDRKMIRKLRFEDYEKTKKQGLI